MIKSRVFSASFFLLFYSSLSFAYVGGADTNYENEARLLETDYRLAVHIPQQSNHGVVIAVIGTGIETTHEAFEHASFWVNTDEIADNGIDDDNNGYIDDVNGYDFGLSTKNIGISDKHETSVAGVIIAKKINEGLRGINPEATIMNINHETTESDGTVQTASEAVKYAADNIDGKCIINMSFGIGLDSLEVFKDGLEYAYNKGCLLITSAGNTSGKSIAHPEDYEDYVVSVTGLSLDENSRHEDASYADSLKFAAPYENIYTTNLDNRYNDYDGTSLSAPVISALASIVWANDPSLTRDQVISKLEEHGTIIENDPSATTTFIKINVRDLVQSYVDFNQKEIQSDIDGDSLEETLYLEVSTEKNSSTFNKGFITHILDDDGTKYSIFEEL